MPLPWIVGAAGQQIGGGLLGPIGGVATIAANNLWPIEFPDINGLTQIYIGGQINDRDFVRIARARGWDIAGMTHQYMQLLTGDEFPYRTRQFPIAAINTKATHEYVRAQQAVLSQDEIVAAYFRNYVTRDCANNLLSRTGIEDDRLKDIIVKLGEQIPGPSDLIRFAVREAFTPQIVALYHYQDELPLDVLPWMQKQGFGGDTGIPRPPGVDGAGRPLPAGNATWFDLYWWSHWELPSVGEGYTMAQRLYQTSRFGPSPDASPSTYFSTADLTTLLKTNDYPTYWRERLEAISYNPLGRVDVRRMFQTGVIVEAEVYHAYRAMGYSDRNAVLLLNFSIKQKQLANIKTSHVATKGQILKYYEAGLMEYQVALDNLKALGLETLIGATLLRETFQEMKYQDFQGTIKTLKKAYMEGLLSDDQTRELLVTAGLAQQGTDRYLANWSIEKRYQHKANSTADIIKAYQLSIINETEASNRLFNLYYGNREVTLIMQNAITEKRIRLSKDIDKQTIAQQKQAEKQAKAIETAAKQKQKDILAKQKEQQKQAKELAAQQKKEHDKIVQGLLSVYTEKNMIAFFKAKQITVDALREVMNAKGWNKIEQEKWLATYAKES